MTTTANILTTDELRARVARVPRIPLAHLPTPLELLPRFSRAVSEYGPRVWIKRDDCTGLLFGGNKARHNEFLIADALAKGAKLVCGEKATSTLMPATLLDHVTPAMRLYGEETFGPVKAIVRVKGVEEAIACANDNAYGLSAAVFGRDIARALNVARIWL